MAQRARSSPQASRRAQAPVARTSAERSSSFAVHDHLESGGSRFFELVCEQNLEGIVCKPKTSQYPFTWIKVKNPNYTQAVNRGEWFNRPGIHLSRDAASDAITI